MVDLELGTTQASITTRVTIGECIVPNALRIIFASIAQRNGSWKMRKTHTHTTTIVRYIIANQECISIYVYIYRESVWCMSWRVCVCEWKWESVWWNGVYGLPVPMTECGWGALLCMCVCGCGRKCGIFAFLFKIAHIIMCLFACGSLSLCVELFVCGGTADSQILSFMARHFKWLFRWAV